MIYWGVAKTVRHETLTLAFAGSSPAIPANKLKGEVIMKIVVKRAGKNPEVKEIKETLENLQEIVGGYIECIDFGFSNILLVCNEEGKLLGLPANFVFRGDVIVGDVFFCSAGREDFGSLTDDQIVFLMVIMNYFES